MIHIPNLRKAIMHVKQLLVPLLLSGLFLSSAAMAETTQPAADAAGASPGQVPAASSDSKPADKPAHWSYGGSEGPAYWGELSTDYSSGRFFIYYTNLNVFIFFHKAGTLGIFKISIFHFHTESFGSSYRKSCGSKLSAKYTDSIGALYACTFKLGTSYVMTGNYTCTNRI